MLKRIRSTIIYLALTQTMSWYFTAAVLPQQSFAEALVQKYTNKQYGFTVDTPPDWLLHERPGSSGASNTSPAKDVMLVATERPRGGPNSFNPNITVAVRDIPEVVNLNDRKKVEDFAIQILKSVPLVSGGNDVHTFTKDNLLVVQQDFQYSPVYAGKEVPLSVTVTAIISVRHGRCFLVTSTAPTETFARYQPIFRDYIQSFSEVD